MRQAANGDTVRVHYRGTLDDGTEFDSSAGRDPLEFTLGSGQVIPGFDNALMDMKVGETKTVNIPPDQAYGESDPQMVHDVPRAEIPDTITVEVGAVLHANSQSGPMQLTVLAMTDETVTLDANHALAGKTLTFMLTLDSFGE
jgi:peptidylprolyl isomerase